MANLMQKQSGDTGLAVQEQAGQYLTFLVGMLSPKQASQLHNLAHPQEQVTA